MSSTDPWKTIMSKIEHEYAIVTFDNKVRVFFARDGLEEQIDFPPAEVRDTVGAGDTFGVGFIDAYLKSGEVTSDAIMTGIKLAQEKVRQIGVFV
jgi:sugar/nucleoside kinase (ribokinase family)